MTLDDEALRGARDEVRDDRVDRDPPAGDRDAGLSRRHELGSDASPLRFAVELERDGHLPDRAVGADGQDDLRGHLEVVSRRHVEIVRRLAQVAELDALLACEVDELGVARQELVQPVLDVEAVRNARADLLAERGREAAARRRDADERCVRVEAERVVDGADDREAVLGLPLALGVEQRDDLLRRVAHDAPRRLPVVRVARLALSEK